MNSISFLLASFIDISKINGYNYKTVNIYKRQVQQMIETGKITREDASIVEELLGIVNTDSIKWHIASKKVSQFKYIMDTIGEMQDREVIKNYLKLLAKGKRVSQSVIKAVKKIVLEEKQ